MTPQQLVGIAVRLFATWLALTSVAYFVSIPKALASAPPLGNDANIAVAYAIGGLYVAGALILWFFPMVVAHKLLPRTQHENRLSFRAYELARVGCSLVGLWLLAKASPSLVWLIFRSLMLNDGSSSFSALAPGAKLDVAVATFETGLAVFFIVKSHFFARLVVPTAKEKVESDI
jgi:Na+/proline symporter